MKVIIVKNYDEMSKEAAKIVSDQIEKNSKSVIGLATGGTPEGMYKELINKRLSWKDVTTFNLDEYVGIPKEHPLSYYTYMYENLFNHIDIKHENVFIPNGNGDINKNGKEYDELIQKHNGVDLQVLGIGENAHIAFNEPGSSFTAGTREVELTESTINANARYFASKDEVPKTAISMGIGTLMKAKKIILLASGTKKMFAIKDTIEGPITEKVPGSILQKHPDVTIIIDEDAAKALESRMHLACACEE